LKRELRATATPESLAEWIEAGYLRNVDGQDTRVVRLTLARVLSHLETIKDGRARDLARCAVLRSGQWALDMRSEIPSARELIDVVCSVAADMADAASVYARRVRQADARYSIGVRSRRTRVLLQSVPGLADRLGLISPAKLVVTSPPYPGVYVNYHRWKVRGRKETPAPFWLANRLDGNGLAYYTMAARADPSLTTYFARLEEAFTDVRFLCDDFTVVVQIVGFHNPSKDLPRYLAAMEAAGFTEMQFPDVATADDGRLWRQVPNRRWWAVNAAEMHTAVEVVLFHRAA
jgi:hypothetical protein